jgi:integrase
MATFKRRTNAEGKTRFTAIVRKKGHPPEVQTFGSLTKARAWAQQIEAAVEAGKLPSTEARKHTLTELIHRYTRDTLPHKRDAAKQKQQLEWWEQQLGAYLLADCTPARIAEYRDKLAATPITPRGKSTQPARPRSPATVNRYLAALSYVFTVAVKEYGWIDNNPVLKVARKKEAAGRTRFLSDDELIRLLDACRKSVNEHLYDVVLLSLATGGRAMEVRGLRWTDVDLKAGTITFRQTKNGEVRAVPVRGEALSMLKRRAKVRRLDTALLFPGRKPQHPVEFRRSWGSALKQASIEHFRWHDLRHTAASYLAMSGCSPVEIAEMLGHKTLQMVRRYSHFNRTHMAGIAEKLASRLSGTGQEDC